MATEEIEISELEFTEELASDNLIPVEGLTDTKATSLQKLRDWLGIESAILKQVPRGVVFPFGGSVAPDGFLICDGSAISRTTYKDLFAVIGTTYGAGDGSTTFKLPNYSNARMVTSSNVAIKGNGKALGLTDGTNLRGLAQASTNQGLVAQESAYGSNVNTSTGQSAQFPNTLRSIGVTTDSSKSGITGTASLASSCKFIIKY